MMPERGEVINNERRLSVNLQHQLGNFRLSIDFQVPLDLTVLFGFSGAGKSLTLRSLAGLLHPERGYVSIDGQVLFDSASGINLPPQERRVGYVPQHYALFPHLTVGENILFALPRQAPWSRSREIKSSQKTRVNELLAVLELEGLERRYPATLSGGQQQRVALARALMAEPRLLLLDEPFNALDVAVRERLRSTLKQFQRHFAVPIVLVTHDHTEVQQLADQVVVLQQGHVEQVDSVQEVFLSPASAAVARLVGQDITFGGHLVVPPDDQPAAPSKALRLDWLQSNGTQDYVEARRGLSGAKRNAFPSFAPTASAERSAAPLNPPACWLPLPLTISLPASQSLITGCIRNDEVHVHHWTGPGTPPVWTARGAVQWTAQLVEAQIQGPSMRLLVRPQWLDLPANGGAAGSMLKIYLSRSQWREVEVMPGQLLLLEIGPEAIHLYSSTPNSAEHAEPC
ncbi:MAG TPA: ATP-binding cassette domain-containing protein [Ktedonobacteraceae bacterium]